MKAPNGKDYEFQGFLLETQNVLMKMMMDILPQIALSAREGIYLRFNLTEKDIALLDEFYKNEDWTRIRKLEKLFDESLFWGKFDFRTNKSIHTPECVLVRIRFAKAFIIWEGRRTGGLA